MDPFDPYSPFKFLIFYYSSYNMLTIKKLYYSVVHVQNIIVLNGHRSPQRDDHVNCTLYLALEHLPIVVVGVKIPL